MVKNPSASVGDPGDVVLIPGLGRSWEDSWKQEMATHSSILTWRIPWTVEPGKLQSMGFQGVRQDLVTKQQQQKHHVVGLLWSQASSS